MDFELPGEDDPRRLLMRSWLAEHPDPSPAQLAAAGLVAPGWPEPWGIGADPLHQIIITDELNRAGVEHTANPIGVGWAGPTILAAGIAEQQQRYLGPLLDCREIWCQLFSEPDAGSDLASLTTRAEPTADGWRVSGSKIWTSFAEQASFGILLARTDPSAPKHRGISYFICPMDDPGVEVRGITDMTGRRQFNEVFLDDVAIPRANLVGDLNDGWRLAKMTLGNERMSLSSGGVLWGRGPTTGEVLAARGPTTDPIARQRATDLYVMGEVLRLIGLRVLTGVVHGRPPGPEVAVKKLLADAHGQRVMGFARDLTGPAGMLASYSVEGEDWDWGFLFSPALTIGGGTAEVLRNIIGEHILGLPRE